MQSYPSSAGEGAPRAHTAHQEIDGAWGLVPQLWTCRLST